MVLLEFSMSPLDKGESLSPYVSRIVDIIDKSGVDYQLTPMGTILEGSWDEVTGVVNLCFRELEQDCGRIGLNLKVDYRRGGESRLSSKMEKVESLVGRKLSR